MDLDTFSLPEDFSGEARLFPLPDVVLLPGNLLPLHIFESRYREMMEDALAGDQLISMATLRPGFESDYASRPEVEPHICVGRLVFHNRKSDGTYDLVLAGVARAVIEQEIQPVRSFRRAFVRLLDGEQPSASQAVTESLLVALDRVLRMRRVSAEELIADCRSGKVSLGTVTDILAYQLPLSTPDKLSLLAEPEPIRRANMLVTKLQQQPPAKPPTGSTASGKFPPEFGVN